MVNYKSAADEIAQEMSELLTKNANLPMSWENFRIFIDNAKVCADLIKPWAWLESGRCAEFQDTAFTYFLAKEKELKSKSGVDCKTRL